MAFKRPFFLLTVIQAVIHNTLASSASHIICPDGSPEVTEFGALNKPGSGRVLQLKKGQFVVDAKKVFLSGMNTAFVNLSHDFGDGSYFGEIKHEYECYLRHVHSAGGNTMKTSLHGTGSFTPVLVNGKVTGLDSKGSLVSEVKAYLRTAAKYDIVIFLSLWDGRNNHPALDSMINYESGLQSYIDNALVPLMKAIKDEPGLGGIEIISQADKLVLRNQVSSDVCYDTSSDGDASGGHYSMQNILRFVSRQADAIHSIDPDIIVTTELHFDKDILNSRKFHLSDSCLLKAGGRPLGYLDFYSINAKSGNMELFKHNATDFHLDKPVVISAFSEMKGESKFKWAYFHGYNGALSWAAKTHQERTRGSLETQLQGLEVIRHEQDQSFGGLVAFSLSKYVIVPKGQNQTHMV